MLSYGKFDRIKTGIWEYNYYKAAYKELLWSFESDS
jgi:hypothetical protein